MNLAEFRLELTGKMRALEDGKHELRPFVCDGSPFDCELFITGTNPRRRIGKRFWDFWSDGRGMDKEEFLKCYQSAAKTRQLDEPQAMNAKSRTRKQMETFREGLGSGWNVLETNVYAVAASDEKRLRRHEKRSDCFEFLLTAIKPKLVFLHGRKAIKVLRKLTSVKSIEKEQLQLLTYEDATFYVYAAKRHMSRVATKEARRYGVVVADALRHQRGG
jgi:hypothetical protein